MGIDEKTASAETGASRRGYCHLGWRLPISLRATVLVPVSAGPSGAGLRDLFSIFLSSWVDRLRYAPLFWYVSSQESVLRRGRLLSYPESRYIQRTDHYGHEFRLERLHLGVRSGNLFAAHYPDILAPEFGVPNSVATGRVFGV